MKQVWCGLKTVSLLLVLASPLQIIADGFGNEPAFIGYETTEINYAPVAQQSLEKTFASLMKSDDQYLEGFSFSIPKPQAHTGTFILTKSREDYDDKWTKSYVCLDSYECVEVSGCSRVKPRLLTIETQHLVCASGGTGGGSTSTWETAFDIEKRMPWTVWSSSVGSGVFNAYKAAALVDTEQEIYVTEREEVADRISDIVGVFKYLWPNSEYAAPEDVAGTYIQSVNKLGELEFVLETKKGSFFRLAGIRGKHTYSWDCFERQSKGAGEISCNNIAVELN